MKDEIEFSPLRMCGVMRQCLLAYFEILPKPAGILKYERQPILFLIA